MIQISCVDMLLMFYINHGVELDDNVIIPNMARHEFTYIDKTVYTNKIICRMIDYLSELKK